MHIFSVLIVAGHRIYVLHVHYYLNMGTVSFCDFIDYICGLTNSLYVFIDRRFMQFRMSIKYEYVIVSVLLINDCRNDRGTQLVRNLFL